MQEKTVNNNNNRKTMNGSTKWIMSIATILIAGLITWVVATTWRVDRGFEAFKATYTSDQVRYETNLESMTIDRNTMKKDVADLKSRLREAERLLDRLGVQTASLEEYVRR